MKNLKIGLEPLQILRPLYQNCLFIKHQQQVHKDQLHVLVLMMKIVSIAMSTSHRVRTPEEQYFIQISTFSPMLIIGHWRLKHTSVPQQLDHFGDNRKLKTTKIYNLTTMPWVQRSLYLNEMTDNFGNIQVEVQEGVDGRTRDVLEQCMTTCGKAAGIKAKGKSRAQKEASAEDVRGNYKQFAEAKHLEHKSWFDSEVFDLVDLRKVKPRNYLTGSWVFTIKTDNQGNNFLMAKARWVLRCFQDKRKEYQQTDSPASTRPGFRMSCQMAASKSWNIFHFDLETAFFQGQSYGVNRDVVCQKYQKQVILLILLQDRRNLLMAWMMPLDAGGTFLTSHCVAMAWFPHELTHAATCCTQHSRVSELGNTGTKDHRTAVRHRKRPYWIAWAITHGCGIWKKRWIP